MIEYNRKQQRLIICALLEKEKLLKEYSNIFL